MKKDEMLAVEVKTTAEFLESIGTTLEEVEKNVKFLISVFQNKYSKLFPTDISSNDIQFIIYVSKVLEQIKDFDGFDRHIEEYNTANIHAHLFTARVAKYLFDKGHSVTIEPEMPIKKGPHPDLKISKDKTECYVECKTSNISNFYGKEIKQQIADLVYDKIPTCDQINLFFKKPLDLTEIQAIFEDSTLTQRILRTFEHGQDGKETRILVNEALEINIIQKPAIIGKEEDFLTCQISGFLENTENKTRSIGLSFMKGGRCVGVYEVVDYSNKLKDKMEQSQKQMVPDYPNIVFLRDSDIIGDPKKHKEFIETYWFTQELSNCSGVAIFEKYEDPTNYMSEKITYYQNSNANINFDL